MARKKKQPQPPARMYGPELRQFTIDFFTLFGATVSRLDGDEHGKLHVRLTEELAEHFGAAEMALCFQHAEPGSGAELVAFGSRAFDRMIAYLERRSALTVLELPRRYGGGEELMTAVRPTNAGIIKLKIEEQVQRLTAFNWRITYRADDKREEIYTVLLDDEGGLPGADEGDAKAGGVTLEALFGDAAPAAVEMSEEGAPLPPKLPPVAQMVRLAERARKYAIYHADVRCIEHEAEILPRLHKVLSRLTTYYQQQIEEVYDSNDPEGEKRRALESDLQRKIAEEVENHRLRVQVQLFSYAVFEAPAAVAEMTLSDGRHETEVRVVHNRYSGRMVRPTCHACGQETAQVTLDREGHITCEACVRECGACHELLCAACGVAACPVCGKENCDTCGRECWVCGERACGEHISACPVCGDTVCHGCQSECAVCGVRQCRSHLRADAVLSQGDEAVLVCGECAVRCPHCRQYSSATGVCSASGQRFCRSCLVECAGCGRTVGPGFFGRDPKTGAAYCAACAVTCETCGSVRGEEIVCAACGRSCCGHCAQSCAACREMFCAEHAPAAASCGHHLCPEHMGRCGVGGEAVCSLCREACAICERPYCEQHRVACDTCGQEYCSECVRVSGMCETCAMQTKNGKPVDLAKEPCARQPDIAALARGYNWLRSENSRYILYLGRNLVGMRARIVVRKGEKRHEVVKVQLPDVRDVLRVLYRR